jgi:hypothetical protein
MSDSPLEMETREEPKFVNFSAGDVVDGTLYSMERVTVRGNASIRYNVLQDNGEMCAFIGTHQLNTKLRPSDVGHRVEIRCQGEDTMIKRGENCMKVFQVRVSKNAVRAAAGDGTEITDADIPF